MLLKLFSVKFFLSACNIFVTVAYLKSNMSAFSNWKQQL